MIKYVSYSDSSAIVTYVTVIWIDILNTQLMEESAKVLLL